MDCLGIKDIKVCQLSACEKPHSPLTHRTPELANNIADYTEASTCLEQVEHWLRTCRGTPSCYEVHCQGGQNPTRLVAVNGVYPSLILSSELSETVEYTTLSHCLGNLDILILKKSNIDEFQQGIP